MHPPSSSPVTTAAQRSALAAASTNMVLMKLGCQIQLPTSNNGSPLEWFFSQVAGSGFTGDSSGAPPRLTALSATVTDAYCNLSTLNEELHQCSEEGTLLPLEASSAAAKMINDWGACCNTRRSQTKGAMWLPSLTPPPRMLAGCGIGPSVFVVMKEQWEVMAKHFNQPGYVPRIALLISPTSHAIHSGGRVPEIPTTANLQEQLRRLQTQTYDEVRLKWEADMAVPAESTPTVKCPPPQVEFLPSGVGPFVLKCTTYSIQKRKPLDPTKLTKDPLRTSASSKATELNLPEEDCLMVATQLCVAANGYLYSLELEAFEDIYEKHRGEFFANVANFVRVLGVPRFASSDTDGHLVASVPSTRVDTALQFISTMNDMRLKSVHANDEGIKTAGRDFSALTATYGPMVPPIISSTFSQLDFTKAPHFRLRLPQSQGDPNQTATQRRWWELHFPSEWRRLEGWSASHKDQFCYDPYSKRIQQRKNTRTSSSAIDAVRHAAGGVASFVTHRCGYHSSASPAPRPHIVSVVHPRLTGAPYPSEDAFIASLLSDGEGWVERDVDSSIGLPVALGGEAASGAGPLGDHSHWDDIFRGSTGLRRKSFVRVETVSCEAGSVDLPIADLLVYSLPADAMTRSFIIVRDIEPIDYHAAIRPQFGGAPWLELAPRNVRSAGGLPISFVSAPSFAQASQQYVNTVSAALRGRPAVLSSSHLCRDVSPIDCLQLLTTSLLIEGEPTSVTSTPTAEIAFVNPQAGYQLPVAGLGIPTVVTHPMANSLGVLLLPPAPSQPPNPAMAELPVFVAMSCAIRRMQYLPRDAWEALLKKEAETLYGEDAVNKFKFHVRTLRKGGPLASTAVPTAFLLPQASPFPISMAAVDSLARLRAAPTLDNLGPDASVEVLVFDHVFDEARFMGNHISSGTSMGAAPRLLKRIYVFGFVSSVTETESEETQMQPSPQRGQRAPFPVRYGSIVATWDFSLTKVADPLWEALGPVPPAFIGSSVLPAHIPTARGGGPPLPTPYPHPAHPPHARPQGPLGDKLKWDEDWKRVHSVLDTFQEGFQFLL